MQIALFQPDIPQNVGSMLRLCACLDVVCHIIEPCGFIVDDKRLRRVAMDYADHVTWQRHASWEAFIAFVRSDRQRRLILLTTKATQSPYNVQFNESDILLLGRESAGVPQSVAEMADIAVRIPMHAATRSLNIVQAATLVLGEGLRQTRWSV